MRLLLIVSACILFFASCQSRIKPTYAKGEIVSREIKDLTFNKILSDLDADLQVHHSDTPSIKIFAAQNILDFIIIDAREKELVLTLKEGIILDTNAKIKIEIYNPQFEGCKMIGYGNINIDSGFIAKRTNLSLMGRGKIEMLHIQSENTSCMMSGDGDIILHQGMVKQGEYAIKGSGNIQAPHVSVDTLKAMISGTGNIHSQCNGDLDATITGDGNIYDQGNGVVSRSILDGRGEVIKK
jgi:hypothetical protein